MRRSARLVAVSLLLLTTAFALPFIDFVTADWDRDYRYRTPTDGFCADAVAELDTGDASPREGFVVDRSVLTQDALADVRRAERNGSYTVETAAMADGPFVFPSDHIVRGTGCYAIHDADSGEYQALVTEGVNHRTDRLQKRAVPWLGRVAAAGGALLLLVGVALEGHRRLD